MGLVRFFKNAATIYREAKLRQKAQPTNLQSVYSSSWNNWLGPIWESYSGAWQQNVVVDPQPTILAFSAVFSCVTGIAGDIAKLRIKLDENDGGIWKEITTGSPWLTVLRKPNRYQNRIQFVTCWIVSKLLYGNTYVLKERDARGVVSALYILDPVRVQPMVAEDGSVWYQLNRDYLAGVLQDNPEYGKDDPVVPASEIIHDRMVTLWHPLVGVSPIYACGTSATMGNRIQSNSTNFFANQSRPGGVLTAPGTIAPQAAERLKAAFDANYGGANIGKIAVLGDGLTFQAIAMPAETSQLLEQLKFTVDDVARAFHYPAWKLNGVMPQYASGPEAITMAYYSDCLQVLIESIELCLDEGLELPANYGTEMDLENLLRMDTAGLYDAIGKGIAGGWLAPNEARYRANYAPVDGGYTPYLQQQYWSLEQLAQRSGPADGDNANIPAGPPATTDPQPAKAIDLDMDTSRLLFEASLTKELATT